MSVRTKPEADEWERGCEDGAPTWFVCSTSNLAFCLSAVSSICRSVILLSFSARLPSLFHVTTGTKMDRFSFLSSAVLSSAREEDALARSRWRSVLAMRSTSG